MEENNVARLEAEDIDEVIELGENSPGGESSGYSTAQAALSVHYPVLVLV